MPVPTTLKTLDGELLPAEVIEGKVVLFVNVASQCGLTPQYADLVELDSEYRDRGLVVIGVPCNQFMSQEPGTPAEIQEFTKTKYGVEFPLLEKQDVNGTGRSPLYQFLIGDGGDIEWNFGKFLVNRQGEVVKRFDPKTPPDSPELKAAIEAELG